MFRTERALLFAAALAATSLLAGPALAQTESKFSGLKMSGDEPIQIESDKLEVREQENMAVFSGNVTVVQGKTLLKAGSLTVYYVKGSGSSTTGSAAIDRLVVSNTVYVQSDDQIATGDKGTFDMKSEILVLSGKQVVLTQGENILKGCTLTVDMKSEKAKLEPCAGGRVVTVMQPKSAQQPAQGQ